MKPISILFLIFFLCNIPIHSQTPTDADPPGPKHVLVVYNSQSDTSILIMNYYKNARGIPGSNIIDLDRLVDTLVFDPETEVEHLIELKQQNEIIKDKDNEEFWQPTIHAWIYFNERVAKPIRYHLLNTFVNGIPLKDIIRFIVLCKDVPFRVEARKESIAGFRNNVPIDGLLNILGETFGAGNEDALLDFYYPFVYEFFRFSYVMTNPYYNADSDFSMNHHFIPNYYSAFQYDPYINKEITLSYLVSHLTAPLYSDVTAMIDNSIEAINATNYDWFIDADPIPCLGGSEIVSQANATENVFNSLGITNYFFDITEDTVTSHFKPIMSYSSNGIHTTLGPYAFPNCQDFAFSSEYIQSQLHFTYAPGAIFNTAESFNAKTLGTYPIVRTSGHGQVADFTLMGGTVGVGHAYEPTTGNIVRDSIMFPSYALGYTFIEAAYLGMPNLTGENVVIGDPLTAIAWGKQTLTQDITWQNTNLVTDTITIPLSRALTLASGAIINLRHNGFITGEGKLVAPNNVIFNITAWQRGLFLAQENNHPKPVWGNHPGIPPTNGFNVYRKIDDGNWNFIAHTYNNYYLDEYVEITPPGGGVGNNFEYQITALITPFSESEYSNTVEINGYLKSRKLAGDNVTENKFSYSLTQNYPNPFNPTTNISYSLKKPGLTTLKVFDILGKEVATLVNENQEEGNYSVKFNASHLPSGIYFYKITSRNYRATKKLLLLK